MAESLSMSSRRLEEYLTCSVCRDFFENPKQLQCNHIYCQECLRRLVDRDQLLACPNCHQVTSVPNGVAYLQTAVHINRLLVLKDTLKNVKELQPDTEGFCPRHPNKELMLYCEEHICVQCTDTVHWGHHYDSLENMLQKSRGEIMRPCMAAEERLSAVREASVQVRDKILCQQNNLIAKVCSDRRNLCKEIDTRTSEHISKLEHITAEKLRAFDSKKQELENIEHQLSICCGIAKTMVMGNLGKQLGVKQTVCGLIEEMTASLPIDILRPVAQADTDYYVSDDVAETCKSYGTIGVVGSPDPSMCRVEGLEVATVGETATIVLKTADFRGRQCEQEVPLPECKLVSALAGTFTRGKVEKRQHGRYKISYRPTIKGRHQLHIKLKGEHIRGSPFSLKVESSLEITDPSDIRNSCSFVIDSRRKNQVYFWNAANLRLTLPDGPLPDEFDGKVIEVRTSTRGSFRFPSNARIMSAIYTIESSISVKVTLEMEHCYRGGNMESLVFGYCLDRQPASEFSIANKREYKCSFNSTHGVIETRHFSHWAVLWVKGVWDSFLFRSSFPEEIVVFPYYQVHRSCIRVNLVFLKRLRAHIEVVKQHYVTEGWKCDTPLGICSARFDSSSAKVQVTLKPDWKDICSDWQLKPHIERSIIEANEEYFHSINLLFRWKTAACGCLDHRVSLDGLVIGDDPAYINLIIDRSSASSSEFSQLSLKNLMQFRVSHSTINVIEEVGIKYMDFGIYVS